MHHIIRLSLAASGLLLSISCWAASHAMPDRATGVPLKPFEQVQSRINDLNAFIGSYPPQLGSADQRDLVYKQWSEAMQAAWLIEDRATGTESTLWMLSELYRQGHNLDVMGAGARAMQTLDRCLAAYQASVACHLSASYFYLSVNPTFAPKGEASLIRLRELLKPKVDMEVERGFVFAYLYQGRTAETVKQLDYFLTLDPKAEWASKLREAVLKDRVTIKKH